jgi:predicted  nucleic acid-binding Zn-ribbon protein
MSEQDNKLEIELLKKDVHTMTDLLKKFDIALEKIQEIASNLSRMVSLQENRIEVAEEATKQVQQTLEIRRMEHDTDIKELHSRITTVNRDLSNKIEETEKTILKELHSMREEMKSERGSLSGRIMSIERGNGW